MHSSVSIYTCFVHDYVCIASDRCYVCFRAHLKAKFRIIAKRELVLQCCQLKLQTTTLQRMNSFNTLKDDHFITSISTSNLMYHTRYLQSPKVCSQYKVESIPVFIVCVCVRVLVLFSLLF